MGDVSTVGVGRNTSLGANALWPLRSAKRCLFGAPDPVELRTHLEKETIRQYEKDKQKWNFDFVAEVPLDSGQYSWKKLRRDDDLSDNGASSTESSCEDIVVVQRHITDYMRKRKLSTNQTTTSKAESKAKRRFST